MSPGIMGIPAGIGIGIDMRIEMNRALYSSAGERLTTWVSPLTNPASCAACPAFQAWMAGRFGGGRWALRTGATGTETRDEIAAIVAMVRPRITAALRGTAGA